MCFAQLNGRASDYPTGRIDQEGVHAVHRQAEEEKKKTFRLHIGHGQMVQSAVGLVLRRAVQGTTSEHAGLLSKHISQLSKPIQTLSMSFYDNIEGFMHLFSRITECSDRLNQHAAILG